MKSCVTLSIVLFLAGMLLAPLAAHAAGPCTIATFSANNWVFSRSSSRLRLKGS
jgi:hypothetical protein